MQFMKDYANWAVWMSRLWATRISDSIATPRRWHFRTSGWLNSEEAGQNMSTGSSRVPICDALGPTSATLSSAQVQRRFLAQVLSTFLDIGWLVTSTSIELEWYRLANESGCRWPRRWPRGRLLLFPAHRCGAPATITASHEIFSRLVLCFIHMKDDV